MRPPIVLHLCHDCTSVAQIEWAPGVWYCTQHWLAIPRSKLPPSRKLVPTAELAYLPEGQEHIRVWHQRQGPDACNRIVLVPVRPLLGLMRWSAYQASYHQDQRPQKARKILAMLLAWAYNWPEDMKDVIVRG